MTKLQQYTFVCAPSMVQHAGLAAMDCTMTGHVDDYRRKRDLVCDELRDSFEFAHPAGGFYIFPKAPPIYTSATVFVQQAVHRNVLLIPGNVFSEHDTHFRISYATDDDEGAANSLPAPVDRANRCGRQVLLVLLVALGVENSNNAVAHTDAVWNP